MAKPATLQFLRHGKILSKAIFPFFVESYNWLLSAFDNLRGDFDANPKNGYITIDKTDPDHPVVRFRSDKLTRYVKGDDTNITFTEKEDGTIAINVYYL